MKLPKLGRRRLDPAQTTQAAAAEGVSSPVQGLRADGWERGGDAKPVPSPSWLATLGGSKIAVAGAILAAALTAAGPASAETRAQLSSNLPSIGVSQGIALAPPPFSVEGGKAVFVDFREQETTITIDAETKETRGRSKVEFEQFQNGFPILDLVAQPERVWVDGREIPAKDYRSVSTPDHVAQVRLVGVELEPGRHTLEVEYGVGENGFGSGRNWRRLNPARVQYGIVSFEMSLQDIRDPVFSEYYMPSNFEFDNHPSKLVIRIDGNEVEGHRVVTNGEITRSSDSEFEIEFPSHFATSSPYLRLFHSSQMEVHTDTFTSEDGRTIPIELLENSHHSRKDAVPAEMLELAKESLRDGERAYGPYPHDRLLIDTGHGRFGGGAMEYAAAFSANRKSVVRHEVGHMWIARSARPADGHAGIVDEAVTTWFAHGFIPLSEILQGADAPEVEPHLSHQSDYKRDTNRAAYREGYHLIVRLDDVLKDSGGLVPKLRTFHERFEHRPFTVEDFAGVVREGATPEQLERIDELLQKSGLLASED